MGDMHVDAKLTNARETVHRRRVWSPLWGAWYEVEERGVAYDLTTEDGRPLPSLASGDSFSFTQTFTAD